MSYVAIWLQACLLWSCAYFQTLPWNDTFFVVDWDIYYISLVVQQTSGVKDLSSLVRYDDSCLAALRHVQSIIPVVRPRPNIRSHSVLFSFNIDGKGKSYFRLSKLILYWTVFQDYRTMAKQLTISDQMSAICLNNAFANSLNPKCPRIHTPKWLIKEKPQSESRALQRPEISKRST